MTYDHDRCEAWFAWFLHPTTQDDKALTHALSNVPPDHWLFVENRIRTALGEAQASFSEKASRKGGGVDNTNQVSNAVNSSASQEQLLRKARLLWKERANRARKFAGALATVDIPGWETSEAAAEWVRASRQPDEARLHRATSSA